MKFSSTRFTAVVTALLAGALAVGASFALSACTNNAGQVQGRTDAEPPTAYTANLVKGSPLVGEVGSNAIWRAAPWVALSSATRETRQLPPTHVACVYDAEHLYVAFAGTPGLASASSVSVWLDCSAKQNGTELMEIVVDAANTATVASKVMWHRSVMPAEVRETPDFTLPMDHITETANFVGIVQGKGTVEGKAAWTLVLAIPFKSLHFPSTITPAAGFNWRFNLLRRDTFTTGAGAPEVVQANLSPVHAGAQQVMPYRMATMTLSKNAIGGVNIPSKPVRVAVSR